MLEKVVMMKDLTDVNRSGFLDVIRNCRGQRADEKTLDSAAALIQAYVRSFLVRRRLASETREQFSGLFSCFLESDGVPLPNAAETLILIRKAVLFIDFRAEEKLFTCLCRYLVVSMTADDLQKNFNVLAMSPSTIFSWLWVLKKVLWQCIVNLSSCELSVANRLRLNLYLHTLLSYTFPSGWTILSTENGKDLKESMEELCKLILRDLVDRGFYPKIWAFLKSGLCRSNVLFKADSLSATFSLTLRPVSACDLNDKSLRLFLVYVLSAPALTWHLKHLAKDFKITFLNGRLLARCVEFFARSADASEVLADIPIGYEVCLLGNMIHLGYVDVGTLKANAKPFLHCLELLVNHCKSFVQSAHSSVTHWHPFLGWYSKRLDSNIQEALPHVQKQIQLLWGRQMIQSLFCTTLNQKFDHDRRGSGALSGDVVPSNSRRGSKPLMLFNSVLKQATGSASRVKKKKDIAISEESTFALTFYHTVLTTFSPLKYELLAGLCYQEALLPNIWVSLMPWDVPTCVGYYLDLMRSEEASCSAILRSLHVFFELAAYLLTVADDYELFTHEKPFTVSLMTEIARFCNVFIFRCIWEEYVGLESASSNLIFNVICGFLTLLYGRHCRRSFTPDGFWLIRDLKAAVFLAEMDRSSKRAQLIVERVPHVIPYKERIKLFRKRISAERELCSVSLRHAEDQPIFITVHRSRLVEDGYAQLSRLSGKVLKGVIRVKFINKQGLDEPGIDQDGVFKEFLEEVIKAVFDPAFNLFKLTNEGQMYPSPSSTMHENYLALFEFVGKMLGKAVFEGIVVDVFLARFVLNHLIGRIASKYYSSLDELTSLDADLYRHLSFIKHYKGDVSELGLTFSCDEEVLGEVLTHDLRPGGRTIHVTNESKISYVHLMAHYRMHVQIKDQMAAFVRGFHGLINQDWLKLFSANEFQQLLSGDAGDIDIEDLRRHTQYFGGFHSNHRVIRWLWDVLVDDFTPAERRLFLKFVTSCSKPPVLGFEYLEPKFSIRCVDVADDQDEGDTLGSVIRGFLAIRKRDPVGRLPTSSTCFNLLKLPNYQKKSTLREKLRYAINSSTGFELS